MDQNDVKRIVMEAVYGHADAQPRSNQVRIGPSELGGCRRRVWHRLNGDPYTNFDTKALAAWMGTAIHKGLDEAVERQDPFSERFLREAEVERDGIMGHVDLYDKHDGAVIDYKTTTKKNIKYFPSKDQRWQVQVYGWLLSQSHEVKTVNLVAICRDGNEDDIEVHSEPYDESVAMEALAWLDEVKAMTEPPAPEKSAFFCRSYCSFYGGACPGK